MHPAIRVIGDFLRILIAAVGALAFTMITMVALSLTDLGSAPYWPIVQSVAGPLAFCCWLWLILGRLR